MTFLSLLAIFRLLVMARGATKSHTTHHPAGQLEFLHRAGGIGVPRTEKKKKNSKSQYESTFQVFLGATLAIVPLPKQVKNHKVSHGQSKSVWEGTKVTCKG